MTPFVHAAPAPSRHADDRSSAAVLKAAERQIEKGEHERAVQKLRELTRVGKLPHQDQAQGYYLLGWAYLYLGERASARAAYQRLNYLDPNFTLPAGASPKLKELWDQARRDLRPPPRSLPTKRSPVLQISSASYVRLSNRARAPRYRGPNPVRRRALEPLELGVSSGPAVSNIAGWTHWIEPERYR